MEKNRLQLFRASIFDFTADSSVETPCYRYYPDGGLVVKDGCILAAGEYESLCKKFLQARLVDYSGFLILPGFIDAHIHFPQTEMIGAYGKQLLDWLNDYTFPLEMDFSSPEYALRVARIFIEELFKHGTTACMAYTTTYKKSVDALFEAASSYNMRLFTGKVMMDRNAPAALTDTVQTAGEECKELISRWHGKKRNTYVLTPRFAISCSKDELALAASLHQEFPDTFIQTHLSENPEEVKQALALFPECTDYLNVYERTGLLTDHTIFAHGIYLSSSELDRIAHAGAVIAHCPTSNLFLGSGLFNMREANRHGVITTIATDVGGGTSFSLLQTLGEAYKIQQLNGYPMNVLESFYKITLGAAKALRIDREIGNFDFGKAADFVVLDYRHTRLQQLRMEYMQRSGKWDIETLLFGLQAMGDDRNIRATYVMGEPVYLQNKI